MDNINDAIQRIEKNPLFYLFLSSRELFHSNFWYWLHTLNPIEALKLFSSTSIENPKFKREHNQKGKSASAKIDILVSDSRDDGFKKVIIENKVKDFPRAEQLLRIENSFEGMDNEFILVTLFTYHGLNYKNWDIVTYREVAEAINPKIFSKEPFDCALIEKYKEFTLLLVELAELLPVNDYYDFTVASNSEIFTLLDRVKLWEGYQKLRASHLVNKFLETNPKCKVDYSINRQKVAIDFLYPLKKDYKIGVQLENCQLRRVVIGAKALKFAENLLNRPC